MLSISAMSRSESPNIGCVRSSTDFHFEMPEKPSADLTRPMETAFLKHYGETDETSGIGPRLNSGLVPSRIPGARCRPYASSHPEGAGGYGLRSGAGANQRRGACSHPLWH